MITNDFELERRSRPNIRGPFDPTGVRYSPSWLASLATTGILSGFGVARGGMIGRTAVGLLGTAGLLGLLYATRIEPRRPVLERVTLKLPNLPPGLAGLRIGLLGAMHLGHPYTSENTVWAVQQIMAAKPDLIAISGDLVSFRRSIGELPELLAPLRAPLGIYAVPGNHDYWEGVSAIQAAVEPLGIRFLINAGVAINLGGARLFLAGVDDMWEGQPDLELALAERQAREFTVLLSHAPDFADYAAKHNVGLQLSGHTHGGHLRLPGLGAFARPFYGLRYLSGVFQVGATQLYVSRGLGGRPLRLLCRPEATLITLSS